MCICNAKRGDTGLELEVMHCNKIYSNAYSQCFRLPGDDHEQAEGCAVVSLGRASLRALKPLAGGIIES